jgi:hypothetical protein
MRERIEELAAACREMKILGRRARDIVAAPLAKLDEPEGG